MRQKKFSKTSQGNSGQRGCERFKRRPASIARAAMNLSSSLDSRKASLASKRLTIFSIRLGKIKEKLLVSFAVNGGRRL